MFENNLDKQFHRYERMRNMLRRLGMKDIGFWD